MSARDYELSINLLSKKNNQPTFFKQYDNGNIIEAEVTRDDVKVILTNETVIAFFELPDKTILQKNCSINQEGNIICVLDNNILSQAGKAYMELVIADVTSISTTSTIILDIEKTIDRNGAVTTIVQWDIVQEILEFDGGRLVTEIETLSDKIDLASQLKIDLGNNITQGTTLKNQLNTAISTAQTKKAELESAITTGDLNNYAKKTDLNEINNTLGSGVVATPSLAYGMNSKIVNPVKVPVIPEVVWSGRHYVNLLGKDGNCEDVSKWIDWLSNHTIDTTNKVFGNSSMKVTLTSASGSINSGTRLIDASKYYLVSAHLKPGTGMGIRMIVENGSNAFFNQTPLITDSSKFTRVSLKLSPSQHDTGIRISFAVDGATGNYGYVDGVMLAEITQAEYNDAGYEPSYVDSYGILTNPYIEIRHDNLVRNGNGEEGIRWWSLSYGNNNPRIENGYFAIDDTSNIANYGYNQIIPCKPNTQYTFSTIAKRGTSPTARIQIGEVDENNPAATLLVLQALTTNTMDTKITTTITTSANAKRLRVTMVSGNTVADTGTAYHKQAMLVEGSSTPAYKSCRIERGVIEGKYGDGDTVTLKNGKAEGLINWKHKILYGKDYDWIYSSTTTGRKVIRLNTCLPGVDILTDGRIVLSAIKYDGKILPAGTITDVDQITSDRPNGTLWVSISATDSGWVDAVNPNADEVKAFMNGWKAVRTAGIRYVAWVNILDGKPPEGTLNVFSNGNNAAGQNKLNVVTSTGLTVGDFICIKLDTGLYQLVSITAIAGDQLTVNANLSATVAYGNDVFLADKETGSDKLITWCKNNVAPGYEGYQLHYKLANPESITDINTKIIGDIPKIDTGDNYIYLDSGMVIGEVANVQSSGGWSRINHATYPESILKNRASSIIDILKNGLYDSNSWNISATADGYYDRVGANMATTNLDQNATYTIDYMILNTIAPNVGSISCSFKQDFVSGVTSVANALESRQKSDSALDRLIDLSLYEEIDSTVFDVFIPYIVASDGTTYINLPFDFKVTKKVTPIIKLSALKIFSGVDYSNVTNLFKMNFVKLDKNKGVIGLYASNSAFSTSIKGAGIYVNYKIVADCRGRV